MSIGADSSSRSGLTRNRRDAAHPYLPGLLRQWRADDLEAVSRPHLVPAGDLLLHRQALALDRDVHAGRRHTDLVVETHQATRRGAGQETGRLVATDPEGVRESQRQVEE